MTSKAGLKADGLLEPPGQPRGASLSPPLFGGQVLADLLSQKTEEANILTHIVDREIQGQGLGGDESGRRRPAIPARLCHHLTMGARFCTCVIHMCNAHLQYTCSIHVCTCAIPTHIHKCMFNTHAQYTCAHIQHTCASHMCNTHVQRTYPRMPAQAPALSRGRPPVHRPPLLSQALAGSCPATRH